MSNPILNYTTQIAADKTLAEIQSLLAKGGATAILSDYEAGVLSALSFRIQTANGPISFRLPGNVQKIYQVLVRDRSISVRLRTQEQAARVAWRIVKVWVEAQLAIVKAGLCDIEQVFLPFAQNAAGETLYESLKERGFSGLALADRPAA